jgi:hypothetical protein
MGGKAKPSNNQMVQFEMQQAAEARQKEAERQARLEQGKSSIDAIFAGGGFDDAFYNKFKDASLGYTLPQLEDQYAKQKEQTTYDLARAGLLRSTAAGKAQADTEMQKATQEAAIRAQADQGVADLRKNVSGQQSAAVSQLYATEDPNVAANTAIQSVQQAQLSTPNLQPLGELFKPLVIGGAGALGGAVDQYYANRLYSRSPNQASYQDTGVA